MAGLPCMHSSLLSIMIVPKKQRYNKSKSKRPTSSTVFNPAKNSLTPHYFVRRSISHVQIGVNTSVSYGAQGDNWCFDLTNGLVSAAGKLINGPLSTISTFVSSTIPNVSEFTNLFDQYKILGVRLHCYCGNNVAETYQTTLTLPMIHYSCNDYDSNTVPASLDDLLSREDCKSRLLVGEFTIDYKPKPFGVVANYAGTNVRGIQGDGWLDCQTGSIAHSGIKVWFDPGLAAVVTQTLVIVCEWQLAFRGVE